MSTKIYSYKVIIIGDGSVGKTSLIKRFVHDKFDKEYVNTLGSDITKFNSDIDGHEVKLLLWDLAGQSGFEQIINNFFSGSNAAIIVFSHEENDIGEKSFRNILKWRQDVLKLRGNIPIILFGNKIDLVGIEKLENNIDYSKSDINVGKLAEGLGFLEYIKTSALSGANVTEAFNTIIKALYQRQKK